MPEFQLKRARRGSGATYATRAIFFLCWRSPARAVVHSGCISPEGFRRMKGHLPMCPSSVFIRTGNGRSALSSIPAFRRSFLLRSPAVSRASCLRKRAAMSQARRGNVRRSRRCSHPTRSRPNQESRNQNRNARAGSHGDTCRRISRHRRSGNLAGLVRVPARGLSSAQGYERTGRTPRANMPEAATETRSIDQGWLLRRSNRNVWSGSRRDMNEDEWRLHSSAHWTMGLFCAPRAAGH